MSIFVDRFKDEIYPHYETIGQLNESAVLEAYFGDGAVAPLFNQFCKFRTKYKGNQNYNQKINYDPDLIKFNRMAEDQFGYYRFSLMVSPTFDYNAFMFNVGYLAQDGAEDQFFDNLKIYKSNKGFRYDKGAKVSAISNIYFGLVSDERFTDREVFGIMLHEIGHSFTNAVLNRNGCFGKGSFLTNVMYKISNLVHSSANNGEEVSDAKVESDLSNTGLFAKIKGFFDKKGTGVQAVIHSISSTVKGMRKNAKYYDYTNEKFADTFASMYGFSADVQTGLQKMNDAYKNFYKPEKEKIPSNLSVILQVGFLSLNNMLEYIMNVKDEHPDGLARIKTQIDYLERELRNTSIDPKMKADLQKHLDIQLELINDFLANADNPSMYRAYNLYYKKLYEKYGGDIREKVTDNQAIFDTIDQRIGDLSESLMYENDELSEFVQEAMDYADELYNDLPLLSEAVYKSDSTEGGLYPIYIITSFTNTTFGKLAKGIKAVKNFSHAVMSFSHTLTRMYSYNDGEEGYVVSGKSGISIENLKGYIHQSEDSVINVNVFFVKHKYYRVVKNYVDSLVQNADKTKYNNLNLLRTLLHKSTDKSGNSMKMICSEFVYNVIKRANADPLHKTANLVRPDELAELAKENMPVYRVFNGKAVDYKPEAIIRQVEQISKKAKAVNEESIIDSDDFYGSPLNELFRFSKEKTKKKNTKHQFPRVEYDRILRTYGDKKKLPPTNPHDIDIAAFVFCRYKTSDLDKFCNEKDTSDLITMMKHEIKNDGYRDKEDLKEVENIIDIIKHGSICKVIDFVKDDDYHGLWYCKTNKKFYANHDRFPEGYTNPDDFEEFLHDVKERVMGSHDYNIDNIEPENESTNESYIDNYVKLSPEDLGFKI